MKRPGTTGLCGPQAPPGLRVAGAARSFTLLLRRLAACGACFGRERDVPPHAQPAASRRCVGLPSCAPPVAAHLPLPVLPLLLFLGLLLPHSPARAALSVADIRRETPVDFAREILPLLRQNCLACHNQSKAKGGLNLETPAHMLKGGDSGPALVPGDGNASLLLRAGAHQIEGLAMPPAGNTANAADLTADELGLLRLWIDQGARGGPPVEAPLVWQPLPSAWQPILSVAVTPDGRLAAAGRGAQVQLVHLPSGMTWGTLADPDLPHGAAHRDVVQSVAFSPDGAWLATGGFREAKLWQLWRPEPLPWPAAPGPVTAAAWSPDGQTAALAGEGFLELRRADDGARLKSLPAPADGLRRLRFSPDGERLAAVTAPGRLLLWSPAAGTLDADEDPGFRATDLAWQTDADTLVVASADGATTRRLRVGPAGFTEITPSANATNPPALLHPDVPAAPHDPTAAAALWSATNALRRARAEAAWQATAHQQATEQLPRAQEAAARAREALGAAEKEAAEKIAAKERRAQVRAEAEQAATLPDAPPAAAEKLKAARDEETRAEDARVRAVARRDSAAREVELTARQLDLAKAAEREALRQSAAATRSVTVAEAAVAAASAATHAPAPRRVADFPGGRGWLARDDAGRFSLWTTNGHALPPAWSPARGEVLATGDVALLLRDAAGRPARLPLAWPEWRLARRLGSGDDARAFPDRVLAVAFSPDGTRLATGGGEPSRAGSVELWEVATGRLLARAPNLHSDTVTALAFSPDGRLLASAGADRFARLSDAATLAPVRNLEGHTGHVLALAWREDGRLLATGGADLTLKFWNPATGERGKQAGGFTREITGVAPLPATGQWVVASGDGELRFFNENGERVRALPAAGDFLHALAASADGAWLVTGGAAGILRAWPAGADKPALELPSPSEVAYQPSTGSRGW